jgi:hypothetical protein
LAIHLRADDALIDVSPGKYYLNHRPALANSIGQARQENDILEDDPN